MADDRLFLTLSVAVALASVAGGAAWLRRSGSAREVGVPALVLGNLLVFLAIASTLHLGAELYYRYVYDTTDGVNASRVSKRWFRRHWHLNTHGFRDDRDYVQQIPDGMRRVTFVGDSFVAAQGVADVADRFANRIRVARPGWDVQTVAKNGSATGVQLGLLRRWIAGGFELDVVVLVYVWNDIQPVWMRSGPRSPRPDLRPSAWLAPWVDHSYAVNALYYRLARRGLRSGAQESYSEALARAYGGEIWDEQRALLGRFVETARSGGASRVALVTFPWLFHLDDEYPLAVMHERLAAFAAEQDVPLLDLLPLYAARSESLMINSLDSHPNEFAHGLAADAVVRFLDPLMDAPADPPQGG